MILSKWRLSILAVAFVLACVSQVAAGGKSEPKVKATAAATKPGADGKPAGYKQVKIEKPMLFDLDADVGEMKDVAAANPDVLAMMQKHADAARASARKAREKARHKRRRKPAAR